MTVLIVAIPKEFSRGNFTVSKMSRKLYFIIFSLAELFFFFYTIHLVLHCDSVDRSTV